MQKIKVGILGSGNVGKTLGAGFLILGHEVMIGSREPEKLQPWVNAAGPGASAGTFEQAARFGELIILATLGTGTENAIHLAGASNFIAKVVIDTTNPLDFSKGAPQLSVGHTDSLGERVQRALPGAWVVKAFNTVGSPLMINPQLPGGPPDMFICGDDDRAKNKVSEVCKDFGWDVIDIGGIQGSRHLEPMCMVWVLYGMRAKTWTHAFKMLR